jgi:hypothetical protein
MSKEWKNRDILPINDKARVTEKFFVTKAKIDRIAKYKETTLYKKMIINILFYYLHVCSISTELLTFVNSDLLLII